VQERLTKQIAVVIQEILKPQGVAALVHGNAWSTKTWKFYGYELYVRSIQGTGENQRRIFEANK
ncbi:1521_t:CDS:2, partial [Acaulospora colombiana]